MTYSIPTQARPNEVAILRVYLAEERRPTQIAKILHYRFPDPVYRVLRKYRDYLAQERKRIVINTTTIHI